MPNREPITLDEAFEGLPPKIREIVESSGWQEKLRRIAATNHLRVDQGAILEDETLRFMTGLQTVEEYAVHLAGELKLPADEFKGLVGQIETEIFMPIQSKIRDVLPAEDGEGGGAVASASLAADEEDDLEALLNQGEEELARMSAAPAAPVAGMSPVAATAQPTPKPVAPATPPAAAPAAPVFKPVATPSSAPAAAAFSPAPAAPAPASVATAASADLSFAAQKLAAPVSKPAESVPANIQRPPAPATPPASSSDPYREPIA